MFSKVLCVFVALSLSSFIAQAAPHAAIESCSAASTVTVTVTASDATSTSSHHGSGSHKGSDSHNGKKSSSKGHGKNKGKSNHHDSHDNGGSKGSSSSGKSGSSSTNGTSTSGPANEKSTATENNPNIQNSLTLDSSVIATGFLNNGQSVKEAGQVASLTSGNNFINFCAKHKKAPLTNGLQITTGSCNPAPMGLIPSTANMPSAKFTFPQNFGTVPANQPFTISLSIHGMETGHFVNAQQNYFAAPQQLNKKGQVIGHSHVVVESIDSFTQSTPSDPTKFAFFKGLNAAAVNGVLTANVTAGLPAGTYKVSTINTAANHQPVLVPIAQHGSLDDAVYFTVTDNGSASAASQSTASASTASPSAKGKHGSKKGKRVA